MILSCLMAEEMSVPIYSCTALPSHPREVSPDGVVDALRSSYTAVLNLTTIRLLGSCHARTQVIKTAEAIQVQEGPPITDSNRRSIEREVRKMRPDHAVKGVPSLQ